MPPKGLSLAALIACVLSDRSSNPLAHRLSHGTSSSNPLAHRHDRGQTDESSLMCSAFVATFASPITGAPNNRMPSSPLLGQGDLGMTLVSGGRSGGGNTGCPVAVAVAGDGDGDGAGTTTPHQGQDHGYERGQVCSSLAGSWCDTSGGQYTITQTALNSTCGSVSSTSSNYTCAMHALCMAVRRICSTSRAGQ
jgi:hypothetical protein